MNIDSINLYTKTNFSLIYFLQLGIEIKIIYMLTLFKKIFIWWNQETFGTKLNTIFFGKFVGKDQLEINIMRAKMEKGG